MLLIAGGDADPNMGAVAAAAKRRAMAAKPIFIGSNKTHGLTWDIGSDRLKIDGKACKPDALFIRHDVFGNLADGRPDTAYRAYGWFTTVMGYAHAHRRVRIFNRHHDYGFSKPVQLVAALKAGLKIPQTLISNEAAAVTPKASRRIVKPVNGGEYCQRLDEVLPHTRFLQGKAATPAIVQERVDGADLRIFRLGRKFMSFEIESDVLDYRTSSNVRVKHIDNPSRQLLAGLRKLTDEAGLDFAAADFKRSADGSEWVFLEVNSCPMFAAFDQASKGALVDLLLSELLALR